MKIDIIKTRIFNNEEIISGVTMKNQIQIPEYGLSLSKAEILTEEELIAHRNILADFIGIEHRNMIYQKQIHSDTIKEVDETYKIGESDGLYTQMKGIVININIADCAAILMWDAQNKVIMGLHSGWKGTAANIAGKGINILQNKYGTDTNLLKIYVSPCASAENYEIGEDVAQYFPDNIQKISRTKYLFDNKGAIARQLIDAGCDKSNIEISELCTISDLSLHSYRRDKKYSGRMSAFIGMPYN